MNKISEVRNELVQHGMIGYGKGIILFDWNRMRTYAALLEPLTKIGKHQKICISAALRYNRAEPTIGSLVKKRKKDKLSIRDLLMLDTTDTEQHEQTIYEKHFFKTLFKMTESEWLAMCQLFPEYNPLCPLSLQEKQYEEDTSKESEDNLVDNTDYSDWVIPEPLPF